MFSLTLYHSLNAQDSLRFFPNSTYVTVILLPFLRDIIDLSECSDNAGFSQWLDYALEEDDGSTSLRLILVRTPKYYF